MADTLTGRITRVISDRGFAFIKTDDGTDYFLHHTELANCGINKLQVGDLIRFEIGDSRKGPRASNANRV